MGRCLGGAMEAWRSMLAEMKAVYEADPVAAVRSQRFIKHIHEEVERELTARLTREARGDGVSVRLEAPVHGSFKDKNVDVAVLHPVNGPLISVGVRSQMSSIGKNILTYLQDIMGEAVSLQDRFPMTVYGYIYLLPIMPNDADAEIDYRRYARLFSNIAERGVTTYKNERGKYDHFAFALVDFAQDPPALLEDRVAEASLDADLRVSNFTSRLIATFERRNPWLTYFT